MVESTRRLSVTVCPGSSVSVEASVGSKSTLSMYEGRPVEGNDMMADWFVLSVLVMGKAACAVDPTVTATATEAGKDKTWRYVVGVGVALGAP